MNAVAKIETPAQRLRMIAKECIAATDTREAAVAMLLKRARKDRDVWRVMMEPLETQAAGDAIGGVIREERRAVWARPAEPDARVTALANMHRSLMDFRLPSGKRLRDATAGECLEAAGFYERQARDMWWKSRWLTMVADKTGDGTVGEALDERAVAALREDTDV